MKSANELVTEWCTNGDNIFEYYFSVLLQIAKRASNKHRYSVGVELCAAQNMEYSYFSLGIPCNREYRMQIYPLKTDVSVNKNTFMYAEFPGTEDGICGLETHLNYIFAMRSKLPRGWDSSLCWDNGSVWEKGN